MYVNTYGWIDGQWMDEFMEAIIFYYDYYILYYYFPCFSDNSLSDSTQNAFHAEFSCNQCTAIFSHQFRKKKRQPFGLNVNSFTGEFMRSIISFIVQVVTLH